MSSFKKDLSVFRREAFRDFRAFRKYYFKDTNSLPDAKFHGNISKILAEMTTARGVKWAIAAPRGSGKSAIITTQYVLYCVCYGLEPYIVIISSTKDQAAGLLKSVKDHLVSNARLIEDFPEVCEVGVKPKPPRWTQYEIETRNKIKVTALGSGQQIRGRKNSDIRPSLIIADDLEGDADVQSAEAYRVLHDWFTKSVLKAGTPMTNIILTGTIHHYGSLLGQFASTTSNPGWNKKISRSILGWPERMDLWEGWSRVYHFQSTFEGQEGPEAARRFYEANADEMLRGARVLWPQRYCFHDLMVMREQDGYPSFDSEMQNQPVNPDDCYFNLEELHYWDAQYESEEQLLRALGRDMEFLGACDPSLGRENRRGDYSAIVNVVRSRRTGKIYVLDADIQRRLPDALLLQVLEYFKIREFTRFGFESNQFQSYMAEHLRTMGNAARVYPNIVEINNTKNKIGRIGGLQALIKSGTILFSRRHRLLLEQLKFFPKGMHDDGLDALEMAVRLCKEEHVEPRMWIV